MFKIYLYFLFNIKGEELSFITIFKSDISKKCDPIKQTESNLNHLVQLPMDICLYMYKTEYSIRSHIPQI